MEWNEMSTERNALKAYVRRTILASAKEYSYPAKRRTAEGTKSAFIAAMCGTDTGWWTDLIYTAPMLQMAHRYRADIAAALVEYQDATGEAFVYRPGSTEETGALAIMFALNQRGPVPTLADYHGEGPKASRADCLLIGLRFAVEWYAGELARDYCPDL